MKTIFPALLALSVLLLACKEKTNSSKIENWKNEILQTEKAFAEMAAKEGIPQAFLKYAAEDAVINRGDIFVRGKEAVGFYYEKQYEGPDKYSLTWEPEFVDVSSSGDLGYTFGKYHYQVTDTMGYRRATDGIFHTVWKRQSDGTWKFVWD
jgi:ketosteroid isomerase-like protein